MTINQDHLMKVLLLAGMEDYCALYQTLGEIHALCLGCGWSKLAHRAD